MKLIILFITISFSLNYYLFAQELRIPLKQKIGFGPFAPDAGSILFSPPENHPIFNAFNRLEFKNIPSDLIEVQKGIIPFDYLQFLYQNLVGTENFKLFETFKNQRSYKTSNDKLSTKPIKCFVKIITAKTREGKPVFIIDINQNGNFDDEIIQSLESLEDLDDIKKQEFNINETTFEISNYNKIIDSKLPIIVFKNQNEIKYCIPSYMVGNLSPENEIYVGHEFRFPDYWVSTIYIDKDNRNIKKNEMFEWDRKFFKNYGVELNSNTLILEELEHRTQNFVLENLIQEDIKTGEIIKLDDYKGKYIFIDIWGSWCLPCLKMMPFLTEIYKEVDVSKIGFIGIAGRDKHTNALKVINDQSILWKNILSTENNNLTDLLNVVKYPTGILINPEGLIIEKDIHVVDLKSYLRKYNLLK
ncbi:TlpA family protein disulfide reductase [Sphingobacterium mizutaii]|uniref:TlpA family protein disulfide reductase n=1 Tax=Sphingobacterium mizutaii TaxID=1010 RepID=UPI003D99C88B